MTREEAINLVKQVLPCLNIDKKIREGFETLVPELRESEDERTRKELIEFISAVKSISESGRSTWAVRKDDVEMCNAFLSYLEKQKEQKPHYCHHEVDETGWSEEYRKAYYDGWNNCNMQHEQAKAEQKPAEWDEYTKINLDRALQIIKKAKGTLQGYQTDDGIYECDKAIECLEHFLYRGLEIEKPAEWSEEDERLLTKLMTFVDLECFDRECNGQEVIDWLKSLRPNKQD